MEGTIHAAMKCARQEQEQRAGRAKERSKRYMQSEKFNQEMALLRATEEWPGPGIGEIAHTCAALDTTLSVEFELEGWYLLKRLTADERCRYEAVLSRPSSDDSFWADEDTQEITVEGVKRLSGIGFNFRSQPDRPRCKWLDSAPLNFYFERMRIRERRGHHGKDHRPSFSFHTMFFDKLTNSDCTDENKRHTFSYENVMRWSRKCPAKTIFQLRNLLIPINMSGIHWVLAVVNFPARTIVIWDSLDFPFLWHQQMIREYLLREYMRTIRRDMSQQEQMEWKATWNLEKHPPSPPMKQPNIDDCGVMTIMHADLVLRGVSTTSLVDKVRVNHSHIISRCRERLAIMCLDGKDIPDVLEPTI